MARATRRRTVSEILIESCTVDDLRSLGDPLFVQHRDELVPGAPISIDWRRYYELEERGLLLLLAVFENDLRTDARRLVGYSVAFVIPHLHHSKTVYAQSDVLFVLPEYRSAGIGLELIRATERVAFQRGATVMHWHAKLDSRMESVLKALGYSLYEVNYMRLLSDG